MYVTLCGVARGSTSMSALYEQAQAPESDVQALYVNTCALEALGSSEQRIMHAAPTYTNSASILDRRMPILSELHLALAHVYSHTMLACVHAIDVLTISIINTHNS